MLQNVEHASTVPAGTPMGFTLVIAFSGGPDSLALLLAAQRLAPRMGLEVVAAHLDHALDPGSADRAERAAQLAQKLDVPFLGHRLSAEKPANESREVFARNARYRFLEAAAQRHGARAVATAHHADDQAETVLLRLLFGSGLDGLGGIAPLRPLGNTFLVRPLLTIRRRELLAYLDAAGLEPIQDPTNLDQQVPRNRVRHALLPFLARGEYKNARADELTAAGGDGDDLVDALCRLAAVAGPAATRVRERLQAALAAESTVTGARCDRAGFEALPEVLQGPALFLLHQLAGEGQPAPLEARRELLSQLRRRGKVRCDCGGRRGRNFYWQADRYHLELHRTGGLEPKAGQFTYTFEASGAEPLER